MSGLNDLIKLLRESFGMEDDEHLTAYGAMNIASVKYCVDKISGHFGQLPCNLHQEIDGTNTQQKQHAAWKALRVRPNGYQTPFEFKRTLCVHRLMWGNGRAYIHRTTRGLELIPLMPDRCQTLLAEGEKVHLYKVDRDERLNLWVDIQQELKRAREEGTPPEVIILPDAKVIHFPGIGFDGVEGLSTISLARRSLSISEGFDKMERKQQKKGYSGGLMLEAPTGAFRKEEEAREFLKEFREAHTGDEAEVVGMLRDGIKANILHMSNRDAQFLESRKFSREEVMLWFGMPTMPGDNASQSYNSLEQKNLAYRIDCLGPLLTSFEEELENKLLRSDEVRKGYYFKFNDGAILRTDKQTTAEVVSTLIAARVMNPNEGRGLFDLNPYEGGDAFENPAVSPGQPGQSQEADESEDDTTQMQARLAQQTVIEDMIGVESNRCVQACKATNFCERIDAFYGKWEQTFANKLEKLGMDRGLSSDHCEESKQILLAVADRAKTTGELTELVKVEVASWPSRAQHLVKEGELC